MTNDELIKMHLLSERGVVVTDPRLTMDYPDPINLYDTDDYPVRNRMSAEEIALAWKELADPYFGEEEIEI
jgi:hypothetical protein